MIIQEPSSVLLTSLKGQQERESRSLIIEQQDREYRETLEKDQEKVYTCSSEITAAGGWTFPNASTGLSRPSLTKHSCFN